MARSTKLELMDHGLTHYSREEYRDCLHQLGRIGRLLGGDRATLQAIPSQAQSFLDVGCGGGDFARLLGARFPNATVVGIDLDAEAIAYAKEHPRCNVRYEHRTESELSEPPNSVDVVTSTLVCHHMTDTLLVSFLRRAFEVARVAVVINDLHRSYLATGLFALLAPVMFRNRLIFHDGLLSIRRAFRRSDWKRYMALAGIAPHSWTLQWCWPFRWVLVLRKSISPTC